LVLFVLLNNMWPMSKPLRRVPWCRHYAPAVVHLMMAFTLIFGCVLAASHQNPQEIPNVIGTALGYLMPCSGFLMAVIIFLEQHFTRFGPLWERNALYYHVFVPALYVAALLFLRKEDLLNAMSDASVDKLSVAYVLMLLPFILYLYRIYVPFSFVSFFKKYGDGLV